MRKNGVWMLTLAVVVIFTVWAEMNRSDRVTYVSNLGSHVSSDPAWSGNLIVPERNERTLEWLSQTRQMLEQKEARIRHVGYDNAPKGREVWFSSPYRWWLGFLASVERIRAPLVSINGSVERAAFLADPLALLISILAGTFFVAWTWGSRAAVIFAMGMAATYPWAATFLPGVAEGRSLARVSAVAGLLALLRGLRGRESGWWLCTSATGLGLALWADVPTAVPLVGGILLGAALQEFFLPDFADGERRALLWRWWSLTGASVTGLAYLLEFAPNHLGGWHLESIHPIYSIVWLLAGEGLALIARYAREDSRRLIWKRHLGWALVGVALAAIPVGLELTGNRGFLVRDLLSIRLTSEPQGVVAPDMWTWLRRDGATLTAWATLLPLFGFAGLYCLVGWKTITRQARGEMVLFLGAAAVVLGCASRNLSGWATLDGVIVVAATLAVTHVSWRGRRGLLASVACALMVVPGVIKLWPAAKPDSGTLLTPAETEQWVERDLARWLQRRAGVPDAVVFAPPRATLTLGYYGGFRGIGTFSPDNTVGFGTALAIAGAQTIVEVQALLQARDVRYIVIPSWDPFFDEFGERYLAKNFSNRKSFLIGELRRGNLPLWLRPIAYPMPAIAGFEHQSALVYEVVEEQSPAIAASRNLDFLVETGQLERASAMQESLKRFPGDVAVLSAQANLLAAREMNQALGSIMDVLESRLSSGADRYLPWDRRVGLAIVLARGERVDRAREQCRRCLADATPEKIRSLSDTSLYGLAVLSETFELPWPNAAQRELALSLLPRELRGKL